MIFGEVLILVSRSAHAVILASQKQLDRECPVRAVAAT